MNTLRRLTLFMAGLALVLASRAAYPAYQQSTPPARFLVTQGEALHLVDINGSQTQLAERIDRRVLWRDLPDAYSSSDGEWIYFHLDEDIYRANTENLLTEQVTDSPGTDYLLGFTPRDEWLVVASLHQNDLHILRIRPDTGQSELLDHFLANHQISPYGLVPGAGWLSLKAHPARDTHFQHYCIPIVGSPGPVIQPTEYALKSEFYVEARPDGEWVAAVADVEHAWQVITMRPDCTEMRPLLNHTHYEFSNIAAWSPDGEWLLFEAYHLTGLRMHLFGVRPDGTGLRDLTFLPHWGLTYVTWSPDSEWIYAESRAPGGRWGLYRMRIDGSGKQFVTPRTGFWKFEGWSPDGEWMVYQAPAPGQEAGDPRRLGHTHLYRMRSDGSDIQPVALGPLAYRVVSWTPDGNWMMVSACLREGDYTSDCQLIRMRDDGSQTKVIYEGYGYWDFVGWVPVGPPEGESH